MSTRAIAPIVGKDYSTVSRDTQLLHRATPASESTDDEHTGLLTDADEECDDEPVEIYQPFNAEPERREITGVDGKTYTRSEWARIGHKSGTLPVKSRDVE